MRCDKSFKNLPRLFSYSINARTSPTKLIILLQSPDLSRKISSLNEFPNKRFQRPRLPNLLLQIKPFLKLNSTK